MKIILYLICVIALLSATGCIFVPVDDDRRGHWEHHDHDEGWHGGDHDEHR